MEKRNWHNVFFYIFAVIWSLFVFYIFGLNGINTIFDYLQKPKKPYEISGLVGYWKFDGNAEDSSGNSNHGKWVGKEIYSEDGVFGKAAYFDGTSNYVTIPNSSSIDVEKGAFSVGVWINTFGNVTNQHFINKHTGGEGVPWGLYFSLSYININAYFGNYSFNNPPSWIAPRMWHFIMLTKDNSGSATIYVDAVAIAKEIIPPVNLSNSHALILGYLYGNLDQGFHGLIDEVVIYNRAILKREVQRLYLAKPEGLQ